MASTNIVLLSGRLTKDADSFVSKNGNPTVKFSIALKESKPTTDPQTGATKFVEETYYLDLVWFGKNAQACAPYLTKGRAVVVNAKLRPSKSTWTDKQTGEQKTSYNTDILVEDLELGAKPQNQQGNGQPQGGYAPQNNGGYGAQNNGGYGAQPNVNYNAQPQNNGGYNARPQAQPNVNYNAQPQGNGGYGARPQAQGNAYPQNGAPQGGFEENIPF